MAACKLMRDIHIVCRTCMELAEKVLSRLCTNVEQRRDSISSASSASMSAMVAGSRPFVMPAEHEVMWVISVYERLLLFVLLYCRMCVPKTAVEPCFAEAV